MKDFLLRSAFSRISIFFVLFISLIGIFFARTLEVNAALQGNLDESEGVVIEHLRLHVSKQFKDAWLSAEKISWEPWLKQQNGFLGRQLLWDRNREEATLLISWASREEWKNIPNEEIENVQKRFEKLSRAKTGKNSGNPFPLVFEGELLPQ